MFVAANARSIGRNDLHSPTSSPRSSPDPDLTDFLRSRIQNEYTFTTQDVEVGDAQEDPEHGTENDDEAEIVLFAGPSNVVQPERIRLSSPGAAAGEPGFCVKKPRSYYFAAPMTGEKEAEYRAVAVTAGDVFAMARIPWPGCAVPWKVRTITSAGLLKVVLAGHSPAPIELEGKLQKRGRKGKKSRIAIRKKLQVVKDKEAQRAQIQQEREEAEREKRTRRNREKKLKRKARDKAKKEGGISSEGAQVEEAVGPPHLTTHPTSALASSQGLDEQQQHEV